MTEAVKCLYCNTSNRPGDKVCKHCGMKLPEQPQGAVTSRRHHFKWAFWGIVIFCLIMMFYLPR